jgi:hypothetical protein
MGPGRVRVRVNLRLASYLQSVRLGDKLHETLDKYLFFQLNTCGFSHYVTSCKTRGWVCRLQLLLVLASAVILRYESRGTHDRILLSQIRYFPNLEVQVPVFMSPRNRLARLYPQALGFLWLAGLRRRYSIPPPHGMDTSTKHKVYRPSRAQTICEN